MYKFHKGKCRVLHLGRNNSMHLYVLGANCLEKSFTEKVLGILADTKLNMSKQCALVANKTSGILHHIRKSFASRLQEVNFALSSGALSSPPE